MNGIGKTSTTQKLMQCQRTQVTMMSDQVPVHEVECDQRDEQKVTDCPLCVRLNAAYRRGRVEAATAVLVSTWDAANVANSMTLFNAALGGEQG